MSGNYNARIKRVEERTANMPYGAKEARLQALKEKLFGQMTVPELKALRAAMLARDAGEELAPEHLAALEKYRCDLEAMSKTKRPGLGRIRKNKEKRQNDQ